MNALQVQYSLTLITLLAVALIASLRVGAFWLRLAFIDLLAAFLVKRLDSIGGLLGINMVSDPVSDLVSFISIAVIIFAFAAARQRRIYLLRAEQQRQSDLRQKHDPVIAYLESIRAKSQQRNGGREDWDTMTTHRVKV